MEEGGGIHVLCTHSSMFNDKIITFEILLLTEKEEWTQIV